MKTYNTHELEEMFDDMLDECHETVTICSLKYAPSDVLKSTDPIAYRCMLADYLDGLVADGELFYDDKSDLYTDEDMESFVDGIVATLENDAKGRN